MNCKSLILSGLPALAMSTAAVAQAVQEQNADTIEQIVVFGTRAENINIIQEKLASDGIVDFLGADDIGRLPDLNIAESLRRIPGVTSIFDEDRGRFVVVRGLNANMNYVTIDGLGVATTDSFGGTGRKVNLEVIPGSAVSSLEVRKTFTPEIDSGAIGGYVNLRTRSAYDTSELYFVAEGGLNFFTYDDVPDSNNYAGDLDGNLGGQLDLTFANTFGSDRRFGLVLSAHWKQTRRDESKDIQAGERYYDAQGNRVSPLLADGSVNPDWNGYTAPEQVRRYEYTNQIEDWGANAKFEYRPNDNLYASVLGYYYAEGQQETRNTYQIRGLDGISNQTETSGVLQIPDNGVRIGWNRNPLDRENKGVIFSTDYQLSDMSSLIFKTGWSYNNFEDFSPVIEYRGAPQNRSIAYQAVELGPRLHGFSVADTADLLNPDNYSLTTYFENIRFSEEDVYDTKLDYAWNQDLGALGFGFQVGAEYRTIDRKRDNARTEYLEDGSLLTPYALQTSYSPGPINFPLLWVDSASFLSNVAPDLPVDEDRTASRAVQDDFEYKEDTTAVYGKLTYAHEDYKVIGGLRFEDVSTEAIVPGEDLNAAFVTRKGGYDKVLPSIVFSYHVSEDMVVKAGASQSLGRPSPGDIARRERRNDQNLTISRGNPDLQPRESINLDLGLEYYFPDGEGLFSVAVFYKDIDKEIFTLGSTEVIGGETYDVTQPTNAEGAKVTGLELGFIRNSFSTLPDYLKGLGVSANVTLVDGEVAYIDRNGDFRTFDRLLEQSEVSGNISLFYNWGDQAEARLSYNYQGDYHDSIRPDPWDERGWDTFQTLDLSVRYKLTDALEVKFQAKNMLDENRVRIRSIDLDDLFEEVEFGRSFYLDAIYKF